MLGDDILVVGAGPCGLAFSALHPDRTRVLEKSDAVGGLCRSVQMDGAVFDIGGHSFHSPHEEVRNYVETLMAEGWCKQRRDARVIVGGQLIDYPFQQNVRQIEDLAVRTACEQGLAARTPGAAPVNFHDWIFSAFGPGVAEHFMLPYNKKLWARDLRAMPCDWVGERVAAGDARPPATSVGKRTPLQSDSQVAYPSEGGFEAIFTALAQRCGPIETAHGVVAIDPKRKTATTDRGRVQRWDQLISTMPLPDLLAAITDCPETLKAEAATLPCVSLKVVLIAAREVVSDQPQRVYCADPEVPAHKIAFNHTSSPSLRRRPTAGIMCEVSYSPFKPARPDEELEGAMVAWLKQNAFLAPETCISATRTLDVKYGYPVPGAETDRIRALIFDYLEANDIYSIGRFGAWEYINSDACIHRAMQLSERLRQTPEPRL